MSNEVNLSSPWITYMHELEAMFGKDPDIRIVFNKDEYEIKLYVTKPGKAAALEQLLNSEVKFGKVTLKISVVPANDICDVLDVFDEAFTGNPVLVGTIPIVSPLGTHRFVIFKNEVVQFYNDQLDDPHGNKSTLYQEIAKDIFCNDLSVNYSTNVKGDVGKPLGEWP